MKKCLIILPCLFLMFQPLNAKVEAPNYHFDLKTLDNFYPQKNVSDLKATYPDPEEIPHRGNQKLNKYQVKQTRYQITVLVQHKDGIITDFFSRLPSYFLHDVFLQSLVNRLGKQDDFKRVGEEAVYIWRKNSLVHVYSAACTITCFPIFYTVYSEGQKDALINSMKNPVSKK